MIATTKKGVAFPLSIALVLLVGVAFSILSFGIVRTLENKQIVSDLETNAVNRVNAVQAAVLQQNHLLESVAALFWASTEVNRRDFKAFVDSLMPHSPQLQAIGYAPFVLLADRKALEQVAVEREGIDGFRIRQRDANGQLQPAAPRESYAPVLFIEPMTGNEAAVGFDLLSEPNRRTALEAARDSGKPQTTLRLRLVQDNRARTGFVTALAVYRPGSPLQTVSDRRVALEGFATQVYWIDELIEGGLSQLRPGGIDLYFYDPGDLPNTGPLYVHASRLRDPGTVLAAADNLDLSSQYLYQGRLDIGNREWRVIATAAPGFFASRRRVLSWVLLAGLMLATILLAAYLRVTARRERVLQHALGELEISETRLRHVIENMPVLMNAHDADGNLIMWNRECERVTGYTADEVLGKHDLPNLHIPNPARDHDSKDFRSREETLRAKDGADHTIAWSNVSEAIPVSGWDSWFIGLDVSERARADAERDAVQKQLLHSQKLESLGVMAGGIAHDFNNLLTAIMGNAAVAQDTVSKSSTAGMALAEVISASDRAAMLTEQLLAYAGKTTIQTTPIDLSEHVSDIARLLRAAISKKVELRLELEDGLLAVDADPAQMQQLVMNMVINGAEACAEGGGLVNVRTGVLEVDAQSSISTGASDELEPGTYVYLEVRDDGKGMDAQTQDHIFDPFFSTKFTGRGLGLAAAVGIVRSHNGSIKVDSNPGEGSVFQVFLPASQNDLAPPGDETSEDAFGEGLVLVVDDEPMILQLARSGLERLGYRVLTAESGRAAVDLFLDHGSEIVCVVLDMTMPDLDGHDTFLKLSSIRSDVLVILSSGYSEVSVTQQFDGKEIAGFLQKPYTTRRLGAKLEEVIGEHSRNNRAG